MIPFWLRKSHELSAHKQWSESYHWLETLTQRPGSELPALATRCLSTLRTLGWNSIDPSTGIYSSRLCELISERPLSSSIIDAMIKTTTHRVHNSTSHPGIYIASLEISFYLKHARLFEGYIHERMFSALRKLGVKLTSGTVNVLYIPVNVRDIHWAVFRVDLSTHFISYGDSLGWKPVTEDVERIQWWLGTLGFSPFGIQGDLPHACQPVSDSVSCGIIMVNTIRHNCFGDHLWSFDDHEIFRLREFLGLTGVSAVCVLNF